MKKNQFLFFFGFEFENYVKGELKAKISNSSNIVFEKPNRSKVTCTCGVVSSGFLFFARKLRSKLGFSLCSFSVQAQKLNQHPAVCDV